MTDTNTAIAVPRTVSEAERNALLQACGDLADADSITHRFDQDLRKHGFVGSSNIAMIVYLATFTRMFPRPVSVAIKGPSSSGKSFSLEAALRYVPKAAYEKFQGLSDKALIYSSDLDLRQRILVIGEAAGMAEGNGRALLRQLLTENEIRYRSVQQTSKEGHSAKELTIKGPVSLLLTTTASNLHPEEETRLLSLHVDHSPEQIKRALLALDLEGPAEPSAADLSCWHALHDYICSGCTRVDIPFKRWILERLPGGQMRILRDAPKVFSLIEAHTLLHQRRRKKNERGQFIAEPNDYHQVYCLVSDVLAQSLRADVPPHIREVVAGVAEYYKSKQTAISVSGLADHLGRDVGTTSRNVQAAIKEEYINDLNPGRGRTSALIPGVRDLPNGKALPDSYDLAKALGFFGSAAATEGEGESPMTEVSVPTDKAQEEFWSEADTETLVLPA